MAVNKNQELKKQKKAEKQAKLDKITNWFMINLAWGVFGFIVLRYMSNSLLFDYDPVTGEMDTFKALLGKFGIVFAIIAVILVVWGILTKFNVVKLSANAKPILKKLCSNSQRFINYGVFVAVLAIVAHYLSIYVQVRTEFLRMINPDFIMGALPKAGFWASETGLKLYNVVYEQEFWATGGLSYAIGLYLVIAFIYTVVKYILIEKKYSGKKAK